MPSHASRHDVCAVMLVHKLLAASYRCVLSLLLVAVVVSTAFAAAATVHANTFEAVTTTSAVNASDSCQMLPSLLLLRLWLSILLCLCSLVMCAALHGMVAGNVLVSMLLERPFTAVITCVPTLSQVTLHDISGTRGKSHPRKALASGYSDCPSRKQQPEDGLPNWVSVQLRPRALSQLSQTLSRPLA